MKCRHLESSLGCVCPGGTGDSFEFSSVDNKTLEIGTMSGVLYSSNVDISWEVVEHAMFYDGVWA